MAHALQDRFASMIDERLRSDLVTVDGGAIPVFNTKYEGNPKAGAVKIPVRGDMATAAYNVKTGTPLTEGTTTYLSVTDFNQVAVNELVDGYDAAAVPDNLVADRLDSAGYAAALTLDTDGAGVLAAEGTPVVLALTKANVYSAIVDTRTTLSNNKVPKEGRFLLASPTTIGLLLQSAEYVREGLAPNLLENGIVGKIAGFYVRESNNLPVDVNFIAGHSLWCHRIKEWTVEPKLVDLDGSTTHIGASAIKGRWVYKHKVSKANTVIVHKAR